MKLSNLHQASVINESKIPNNLIRIADHAMDRVSQKLPQLKGFDKSDIAELVASSKIADKRNLKILHDIIRRKGLKWKPSMFMLYDLGNGSHIVFPLKQVKFGNKNALLVPTAWVDKGLY